MGQRSMKIRANIFVSIVAIIGWAAAPTAGGAEPSLVGHWKLLGDCRDSSGNGNHGVNHGVDLEHGAFDGEHAYIEVPTNDSLKLGIADFAICAWINTPEHLDDIVGDVVNMYDPALRRGITLTINSSSGGYQSQGTDRHVHFGIDNAHTTDWQDCGHPNPASNYVSNSLTVYKGKLYAGTSGGEDEKDWRHVYRYEGGQVWTDCGQVGDGKIEGVGPLIVHNGDLYAVTTTIDFTRVQTGNYDPGRVYRYLGGTQWEDCGQPSENRTLNCIASYKGKLYVGGGPESFGVFVLEGDSKWQPSKVFSSRTPPRGIFPHAMCRHNGKLFVAYPGAYAFDGDTWTFVGETLPSDQNWFLQTHSMTIFQGKLHAGTWPESKVSFYEGGENWQVIGRAGVEGTEVNSLAVYNGKLYGGALPYAEACRYDGEFEWTSLRRFYSPAGWQPGPPGKMSKKDVCEASRVTSLTVYNGRLFASIGSSTSSILDAPADVRGKVFSMEAGKVASYEDDLGRGWKHIAAVRSGGELRLYIDGKLASKSTAFDPAEYDLSTGRPLRIGFGPTEYFDGRMSDVRLYNGALSDAQIQHIYSNKPD
jgi:Concanavalin A-like lectin/glucanases superfamily